MKITKWMLSIFYFEVSEKLNWSKKLLTNMNNHRIASEWPSWLNYFVSFPKSSLHGIMMNINKFRIFIPLLSIDKHCPFNKFKIFHAWSTLTSSQRALEAGLNLSPLCISVRALSAFLLFSNSHLAARIHKSIY